MTSNVPTLSLIYQKGCHACASAKPQFKRLSEKFPQFRYRLLDMDMLNIPFPVLYTPTYHLALGGSRGGYYVTDPTKLGEGKVDEALEKWMRACFAHYEAHRGMIP